MVEAPPSAAASGNDPAKEAFSLYAIPFIETSSRSTPIDAMCMAMILLA